MITIPDGTEIAGTYRVEARLGGGAFGTVYRVHHRFLGRMALKLLACPKSENMERLAQEGAAHARLSHPNITRVFDVNVTEISGEKLLYIASEYMPLGDLHIYLGRLSRLPLDEWAILASDILSALAHAHEQPRPLLHRDIKPANIFLGGEQNLVFKLGDFGVSAELLHQELRIVAAAGTIAFQAPECAFGAYLPESDIYGAGLVLYRALTGTYPRPPGMDGTVGSGTSDSDEPPPPSRFRLDCSAELDSVILRAIAHDPFARFQTARELRAAVAGAISSA